ncbi:aldolase [Paenibacillus tarimensis]
MIPTAKQTLYKAFGMIVASEIALPELLQVEYPENGADIEIQFSDLTGLWNELDHYEEYYAFKEDQFLVNVPEVAIFCIKGGSQIYVSPESSAEENKIRLYLLGTCMGAILMQRKILPLHGSAVVIDGKAYAFVGDSGAGKSTLAAAFLDRGYPLLSDDVIAVSLSESNQPVVIPAYPQQKLWEESIVRLGMETGNYSPLYLSKYAVPVSRKFYRDPVPLAGIYELVKSPEDQIEMKQIKGLERFPLLRYHTYRNFLIPKLGLDQWHFLATAAILGRIEVNRIRRPISGFSVNQIVLQLLSTLKSREV